VPEKRNGTRVRVARAIGEIESEGGVEKEESGQVGRKLP